MTASSPAFDRATIRARLNAMEQSGNWRLRKEILVPQILMRKGKLFGGRTTVTFSTGTLPVAEIDAATFKFTPAAVLVPLVEHAGEFTVLLTERTSKLKQHAGEIAFPGGRAEPTDADSIATALRETREEIGLDSNQVEIVGRLAPYVTGSGYEVVPIVGVIPQPLHLTVDAGEVESVFEVPLSFILDAANHRREMLDVNGFNRVYYVMPYGERRIWGTTAAILVNFYDALMSDAGSMDGLRA